MKYILIFLVQTFIVVFIYSPVVILRYIWTFRWNDKFDIFPHGLYQRYSKCYYQMTCKINGKKYPQTF